MDEGSFHVQVAVQRVRRSGPVDYVENHNNRGNPPFTNEVSPPFAEQHNPVSETLMTVHFLPPALDRYDTVVEDAIATCNGDLRGALKALIIANEFLEKDLLKLTSGQTDAANKSMKD